MQHPSLSALAIVLLNLLCVTSWGQSGFVAEYSVAEGLARPDVSCVFQDHNKTVWVGTNGAGIYRFNLGRFTREAFIPDETGYHIVKIDQAPKGLLYVLSELGLFAYDGYGISRIADPGVIDFVITTKDIWWITDNVICRRTDTSGAKCEPMRGKHIIFNAQEENVLVINGRNIQSVGDDLQSSELTLIPGSGSLVYCGQDDHHALWFYAEQGELVRLSNQTTWSAGVGRIEARSIVSGAIGNLVIGARRGVFVFDPTDSVLTTIPVSADVQALYYDDADRLWICTKDRGLLRYFGERHRTYSIPNTIQEIRAGRTASTSVLLSGQGFVMTLGDPMSALSMPDAGQYYLGSQKRAWALSETGLWLRSDTAWVVVDSNLIWNGGQNKIIGSDIGGLWLQLDGALWRYGIEPVAFPLGVRFRALRVTGEIPDDVAVGIYHEEQQRSWRVGCRSIGVVENLRYKRFLTFPFDVLSAFRDTAGIFWFGTEAAGIYRLDPDKDQAPLPVHSTYPLRTTDIVFLDKAGSDLIAGTDRHVLRLVLDTDGLQVSKVDVLDAEAGVTLGRLDKGHFGYTDDGHLLILNGAEVIEFNLNATSGSRIPPTVQIASIQVNGVDLYATTHRDCLGPFYQLKRPLKFTSGENRIGIALSGNSIESEVLLYKWKLNGLDSAWSELTTTSDFRFDDIPAGAYSLDVRICDQAGNCTEKPSMLTFGIRRAVWLEWWFIAIAGIMILVVGWWTMRLREKRKAKTADLEKRRLEAELNALTLEQKALQLQMNPHFIFNALQTVRSQIQGDHLDSARENLTHFAKLMRSMLDASRAEKITLEDELAFLRSYVEVEQMTKSAPIRFNVVLSDDIEPFAMELPPMLIQPVIENAIKYGGTEQEIVVDLRISADDEILVIHVEDQGRGQASQSEHKSASLDIIRGRLKHLGKGGGLEIDHKSEHGTRVTLRIPC